MRTILHISPHMGGGIGRALSSLTTSSQNQFVHKIALLEEPEKKEFIDICVQRGIAVDVYHDLDCLRWEIEHADIVQIEWWGHPATAALLAGFPDTPVRIVSWAHVSGCNYPYIPYEFATKSNMVFTSPYSLENPYWTEQERSAARRDFKVVPSVADYSRFFEVEKAPHDIFTIGYIGTLSFAKLHPEIRSFCDAVDLPRKRFIFVGDMINNDLNVIKDSEILNYTQNVPKQMANFDVFGYVLNPCHFGTTENVLLEAMAAGLPVIVLDQCAEKHIIKDGETGFIVKSKEEYAKRIRFLFENPQKKAEIGRNARAYVKEKYKIETSIKCWNHIYEFVMEKEKRAFSFKEIGDQPWQWLLYFMPPFLQQNFCNCSHMWQSHGYTENMYYYILTGESKSSVLHYHKCFPTDEKLLNWTNTTRSESTSSMRKTLS